MTQSRFVVLVAAILFGVVAAVAVFALSGGGGRNEQACDGPNMVYRDVHGSITAVAPNDPRCTGREGTQS